MNQKELTKTFSMIANSKNPLVSMLCTNIFHRFKSLGFYKENDTNIHFHPSCALQSHNKCDIQKGVHSNINHYG